MAPSSDDDISAGSILRELIVNQYQAIVAGGAVLASVVTLNPMPLLIWLGTELVLLPILSLTYNVVGHSNCRALPKRWRWLSNAQDHHLHHACHRGNYGFLFTFMDRLLGPQLPHDAAQAVIAAGLAREARRAAMP